MPVIKRYPNRKLYNTETKQYITLEEIAHLIRRGEEIQVIDNASGEDLTTLTLTQIIFEQEKKQSGFLPHHILSGLIQSGGDRLNDLQRTLASTVGLMRNVDEEIRRRVSVLVKQGELPETEGQRLIDKLLNLSSPTAEAETPVNPQVVEQEIEEILARRKVPTRQDIDRILGQLETLADKLDELGKSEPEDQDS